MSESCEHPTTKLSEDWAWVICALREETIKYNPAMEPPIGYCDTKD